jgi:hypothetical protein
MVQLGEANNNTSMSRAPRCRYESRGAVARAPAVVYRGLVLDYEFLAGAEAGGLNSNQIDARTQ